jgi:hypothetical protein
MHFRIFFWAEILLDLKKTPVSLNYREDNGAFLPIAPSYFTV